MGQFEIIDVHAHIFPKKIREKAVAAIGMFYTLPMKGEGSSRDLLKHGRKINVKKYVVHSVATNPRQVMHINDFIAEQVMLHPEFIGFATIHPDMENLFEEIERAIGLGLHGIKLHPDFQQFDIDSPEAVRLYKIVNGRVPILMHMGDKSKDFSAPRRLARVMELFPEQVFIAAHLGGYSTWEDAKKYVIGKPVYIDTSSSLFALDPKEASDIIRAHGADKVLFGTDYPMWLHEEEYARFCTLPLTDAEREAILYENARKLLQITD